MTLEENNHLDRHLLNHRTASSTRRRVMRTVVLAAAIAAVAAGLVGAGVHWHTQIAAVFHKEEMETVGALAAKSKQLWTCGMHPQVIQDHPGDCPICHMKLTPLKQNDFGNAAPGALPKVAYWWDPMIGAESISEKPGKSSMGMDLVPVYEQEVSGGMGVMIDPVVVQNMGVRVASVTRGPLKQTIRAVGYLEEAQPLIHDINLRVSGWIEKLYASTEGQHVEQGSPLFDLYSPEVQIAVQELIAARRAGSSSEKTDELTNQSNQTLLRSGRGKLDQWGLDAAQIDHLAGLDKAPRTVTFKSPVNGHVTVKNVVEGSSVKAGERVLQIVDHGTLWLDAQVYEQDLPYIRIGQTVTASIQATPGRPAEGKIIFIAPHVDPSTRTATVRVEISNPEMMLRPGMYATAEIVSQLSEDAVLVPREAVIDTGTRAIAFVSAGNGRFEPRSLKLGVSGGGDSVEVLSGVAPGETVVTSGQFLLDAESRMKEAIQRHLGQQILTAAGSKSTMTTQPVAQDTAPMSMADGAAERATSGPSDAQALAPVGADAVYRAYLDLGQMFSKSSDADAIDVKPLERAAQRLAESDAGKNEKISQRVLDAAKALGELKPGEQRKGFKTLSDAVLSLVEVLPPSAALGDKLYVAHCPMAFKTGADWLQEKEEIANPYLTNMRKCGSITRMLTPGPQKDTP